MLKGMEGCFLGVWVAHGEGNVYRSIKSFGKGLITRKIHCIEWRKLFMKKKIQYLEQ